MCSHWADTQNTNTTNAITTNASSKYNKHNHNGKERNQKSFKIAPYRSNGTESEPYKTAPGLKYSPKV